MIHLKLNDDAPKYNDVIWGNRGRRLKMSNLDLLRMVKMCLVIEKGSHIK